MPKGPHKLPPRYPPKKPYIKPEEIHYRDAHLRIAEGKRIPRGTLVTGFPEMREVSVSRIKVTFLGSGEVKIPRYKQTKDGTLKVERYDVVKDVPAAIRRSWRTLAGIKEEMGRVDTMYACIQGLHEALIFEWNDYNPAQRKAAADYAAAIGGIFHFERLSEPHKIKAIERLREASNLLESGNVGAAAASLIGAANDLIERKNVLLKQEPKIDRRGRSIAGKKYWKDNEFYGVLDRLIGMDTALSRLKSLNPKATENFSKNLTREANILGRRKDKRTQQCAALLHSAAEKIRIGDLVSALPKIRLARKNMTEISSESSYLYDDRLEWVAKHPDIKFKARIVRNQLNFFADNVEYWAAGGTELRPPNLSNFLSRVANALSGANPPQMQKAIMAAADLIKAGRAGECEAHIRQILSEL